MQNDAPHPQYDRPFTSSTCKEPAGPGGVNGVSSHPPRRHVSHLKATAVEEAAVRHQIVDEHRHVGGVRAYGNRAPLVAILSRAARPPARGAAADEGGAASHQNHLRHEHHPLVLLHRGGA